MLERDAFIVIPKEPYIQWAASIDSDSPAAAKDIIGERTIYLVTNDILNVNVPSLIEDYYSRIFVQELESWSTDESTWPRSRDRETFDRWFDVVHASSVFDMSKGRIYMIDADF
jgi:hypothetical protein